MNKDITLILAWLGLCCPLGAQTLFVPNGGSGVGPSQNGNVGVGTAIPPYMLYATGDIGVAADKQFIARYNNSESYKGTFGWSHLQFGNNGPNWIVAGRTQSGGSLSFIVNNTSDYAYGTFNGTEAMHIAATGNVGVGTSTPAQRLTVLGGGLLLDGSPNLTFNAELSTAIRIDSPGPWARGYGVVNSSNETKVIWGAFGTSDTLTYAYVGPAYHSPWMVYSASGNVGIGTTNPTQKLSVNGTVRAQEVIVDTGWSDYVFDESYKLKALSETEAFIKAEKHLPGIPSASEVAEKGISLGDMQAKLLAKIEELTLHQIALQKEITEVKLENTALRQEVEIIKTSVK